ncbi:autophagy protein 13 [Coemansia sp. RSA 552]|nr:autophagy protein 13 [Coemansia sp. RSA 552]
MTQRPSFFWSRHGNSPHSEQLTQSRARDGDGVPPAVDIASVPRRRARATTSPQKQASATDQQPAARVPHQGVTYRLPPNTGSPSAAPVRSVSQSSSHSSSSPSSPSSSINPYGAGSLRAMLQTGQSPARAATEPGSRSRMPINVMPANIRRVDTAARARSEPGARHHVDGSPLSSPAAAAANAGRDARCEQIVQNFYSKAAQVIAHLRGCTMAPTGSSYRADAAEAEGASATLPPRIFAASSTGQQGSSLMYASSTSSSAVDVSASGRRINRWFSLNLEDIGSVKEEAKLWRHAVASSRRPPPMFIELSLDVSGVSADDELQVTDIYGRPWTVDLELDEPDAGSGAPRQGGRRRRRRRATSIMLEVWRLDLDANSTSAAVPDLPRVYKHAIVFFRSLYSFANLLPCVSLARQVAAGTGAGGIGIFCSFHTEMPSRDGVIDLDVGLTATEQFLESHTFDPVSTPMGTFTMSVQYRRECLFSCISPQGPLPRDSFTGLGAMEDTYFAPTLSSRSGSNFSLQRQHHVAQPPSTASPRPALYALPWGDAGTVGSRSPRARHRLHSGSLHHNTAPPAALQSQQRQGSSLGSDRGLTIPSVNPFRARPLSMGDSSSLPNYVGMPLSQQRGSSRLSSEWYRSGELVSSTERSSVERAAQRRISLGARGRTGELTQTLQRSHTSGSGHSSGGARPHSMEHKPGRAGSSGSGGGLAAPGADSGSVLHRSVMLRRFGDSLSPTEPHRHMDVGGRTAGSDVTASAMSKSPPKPSISSMRSMSSGSSGSVVAGRSGLGIAPFKSPSLSESPSLGVGTLGDISTMAAASGGSEAQSYPAGRLDDDGRRRGYTVAHDEHEQRHSTQQATVESPPSIGAGGGHSRRLSTSFGNRRASTTRRHPSMLGTPSAERPVTGGLPRRHTIVEGRVWPTSEKPAAAPSSSGVQDIDDFIRMVETKKPLKVYSQRDSSKRSSHIHDSDKTLAARPHSLGKASSEALSPGPSVGATGLDRKGAPVSQPALPLGRPGDVSLRKYQGILDEFDGISRDMEKSVVLQRQATRSVPDDIDVSGLAEGEMSGSPFRRVAMPNPLRGSGDRSRASRPPSLVLAATGPSRDGSSVDLLRQAFDGLSMGSRSDGPITTALTSATQLPVLSPRSASKAHVRNAAPGLDMERERPLPQPVSIPRTQSSDGRRAQLRKSRTEIDSSPDQDNATAAMKEATNVRGQSQPISHAAGPSPSTSVRGNGLQALSFRQAGAGAAGRLEGGYLQQPQPRRMSRGPAMRSPPDPGPLSYRSDFGSSGSSQLGALLSVADDGVAGAMKAPRSTPATPSQRAATTAFPRGRERRIALPLQQAGPRDDGDQLRSHFPPLSFIMPRSRVDQERSASTLASNNDKDAEDDDDDEDLMFHMEASVHQ